MRILRKALPVLVLSLCAGKALAVPSFARQTGLTCNVCHSNPPALTAFGRNFKLQGYVLSSTVERDRIGDSENLLLTKYLPLSAMVLISNTTAQTAQPLSQSGTAGFPQQLSIFLAGAFGSHFGGFSQVTYTHANDHFAMDNTDLRYSNHTSVAGHDLTYGFTANNNPGVEDLWNSTPVWGYPYISTAAHVSPIASPIINGALAQDVAGVGVYGMFANHLYTNVTMYRSEHVGGATPVVGTGYAYNIAGAAPYWRAAWQQSWGRNYLELGTYGIYLKSHPDGISGLEDRYVDPAFDFQYERLFGKNTLEAHGSYIYESSNLAATTESGGATLEAHHLNTTKLDATYHWRTRYSLTGAGFTTTGDADPLLRGPGPITGSDNGRPNTSGYIAQASYLPVQNINFTAAYTGYTKFNGAGVNYDGAGRSAADNNTLYIAAWISF